MRFRKGREVGIYEIALINQWKDELPMLARRLGLK